MALNLQNKKAIVAEVHEMAKVAHSVVLANACGISVDKITTLRKAAREKNVSMHVVRNTLLRRALEGTPFQLVADKCVGPTMVAFSMGHPGAAARLFRDFIKENALFEMKEAALPEELIAAERLADLPTKEEAIARLMATMKETAAGKLVRTLAALRDQKQAA